LTAPSPGAAPAPQANTEEAVQKFIRGNLPALNSLKRYSHIDGYSIEHDENGYFLRIALNNHDRDLQEHRTKTEEEVAQMRNGEPAQIRIEYVASGTPPAP
ncbi:MAG: hypothetical protein KGK30_10160, partial [Elusimicrobia bacterium]|nr:hypothetical protein [Elusimicrobiota bacterium]